MRTVSEVFSELKTSFTTATQDANFTNCVVIYFILFVMVIILPVYLYFLSQGEDILTAKEYSYAYMFMYIMGLFLCVVLFLSSEKNKKLYMGIFAIIFAALGVLIYYYLNSTKFNATYSAYFAIAFQAITILIIVVALALTYKIFENNFRKSGRSKIQSRPFDF